jgi:hypothetical protein
LRIFDGFEHDLDRVFEMEREVVVRRVALIASGERTLDGGAA